MSCSVPVRFSRKDLAPRNIFPFPGFSLSVRTWYLHETDKILLLVIKSHRHDIVWCQAQAVCGHRVQAVAGVSLEKASRVYASLFWYVLKEISEFRARGCVCTRTSPTPTLCAIANHSQPKKNLLSRAGEWIFFLSFLGGEYPSEGAASAGASTPQPPHAT